MFSDLIKENEELAAKDEETYVNNAKKIVELLLKEDRRLFIAEFIKEILQGLYPKLTSKEYQVTFW